MKKSKRIIFCIFFGLCIFFAGRTFALDVPALKAPVTDLAGVISPDEYKALDAFLRELDSKSDLQIAVLTLPSLEDENLEDYAVRVFNTWKLGSKEKDSGVLLLVSVNDRKIRIEVGYGLEPLLTATKCGLIIRNVIAPKFREERYGDGISEAVRAAASVALEDETLLPENANLSEKNSDSPEYGFIDLLVFLIFFLVPFFLFRVVPCLIWMLFRYAIGHKASKYEVAEFLFRRNSGGSSGGGSGGGGFSGGGGSSGGGGASGSW